MPSSERNDSSNHLYLLFLELCEGSKKKLERKSNFQTNAHTKSPFQSFSCPIFFPPALWNPQNSPYNFPYSLTHYRSREGQDWSTYTVIFWTISFTGCSIGGSFQELRETRGNSSDCWLSYRLRRHTNHHLIRIFVIWVWDMIFWLWLRFRCERAWCCVRIWSPSRSSIFGCFRVINWTSRLLNLLS